MVFDRVARETAIPMLSLVQVCVSEAKKKKFNKLLLLGTEGTMKDTYFKELFEKEWIQVVTPSEEDCKWIGWHIENELEHDVITKDTKEKFIEIANKGIDKAAAENNTILTGINTHQGDLTSKAVADSLDLPFTPYKG